MSSSLTFAPDTGDARPVWLISPDDLEGWILDLPEQAQGWVRTCGFVGKLGQVCVVPNDIGGVDCAVLGLGSDVDRLAKRFGMVAKISELPVGVYQIHSTDSVSDDVLAETCIGWLSSAYRFERYADQPPLKATLVAPPQIDAARIEAILAGEAFARTLINTPSNDMGPADLESAARSLARAVGADVCVVSGTELEENFPMIHAVGQASTRPPRLIDMRWGSAGPLVTLVGKGVCFDTGGLNLKPGGSMGLMKKDMGGAAHVLGLGAMIMATQMPLRLRILIPAVENSVAGNAFRPSDILVSRKGLTVEINNTDAEGRLVLADALTLADEEKPDLMICMATLTGAARVAVGPDIAPFFTRSDALAQTIMTHASGDPCWRLPLHAPYEAMIEPGIADLDNAPKGGMAGASTAALFLHRFVTDTENFVHFDVYGWQSNTAPGRPKGGAPQGLRALFDALPDLVAT